MNTSTGRFMTMDTIDGDPESPLSLHKYLYVVADPSNDVDPSGLTPLSDFVGLLNAYLALQSIPAVFTAVALGRLAHTAIEADVLYKWGEDNIVAAEVPVSTGRIDLIVNKGIYEIKPLGGVVNPAKQLQEYLLSTEARNQQWILGGIEFDDYVNSIFLPFLPPPSNLFVKLHYELTSPGVIEYDFQFDIERLVQTVVVVSMAKLISIALQATQAALGTNTASAFAF